MSTSCPVRRIVPVAAGAALFAAGVVAGMRLRSPEPQRVFAATAAADDSFAACTAPVGDGVEGVFLLDFETGDLTGGVLNRASAKFTTGYHHNVLKDLEFKAGKVKNPRFLLTTGIAAFAGAGGRMTGSVLYVTDASTGVTVAYGIPWNAQQTAAGGPAGAPLVPLDIARPRGGKTP